MNFLCVISPRVTVLWCQGYRFIGAVQIATNLTRRKYEFAEGLNLASFSQGQLRVRVSCVVTLPPGSLCESCIL